MHMRVIRTLLATWPPVPQLGPPVSPPSPPGFARHRSRTSCLAARPHLLLPGPLLQPISRRCPTLHCSPRYRQRPPLALVTGCSVCSFVTTAGKRSADGLMLTSLDAAPHLSPQLTPRATTDARRTRTAIPKRRLVPRAAWVTLQPHNAGPIPGFGGHPTPHMLLGSRPFSFPPHLDVPEAASPSCPCCQTRGPSNHLSRALTYPASGSPIKWPAYGMGTGCHSHSSLLLGALAVSSICQLELQQDRCGTFLI